MPYVFLYEYAYAGEPRPGWWANGNYLSGNVTQSNGIVWSRRDTEGNRVFSIRTGSASLSCRDRSERYTRIVNGRLGSTDVDHTCGERAEWCVIINYFIRRRRHLLPVGRPLRLRDRQHPIQTAYACVADRKSFLTTRGRLRDAYPFVRDGVGDGRRNTAISDRRPPPSPYRETRYLVPGGSIMVVRESYDRPRSGSRHLRGNVFPDEFRRHDNGFRIRHGGCRGFKSKKIPRLYPSPILSKSIVQNIFESLVANRMFQPIWVTRHQKITMVFECTTSNLIVFPNFVPDALLAVLTLCTLILQKRLTKSTIKVCFKTNCWFLCRINYCAVIKSLPVKNIGRPQLVIHLEFPKDSHLALKLILIVINFIASENLTKFSFVDDIKIFSLVNCQELVDLLQVSLINVFY